MRAALSGPVLALEASTRRAGVALLDANGESIGHWMPAEDQRGTAELGFRMEALLKQAGHRVVDLAGVVVGIGPGSYTGLRSAISLARGLAFGAGLPMAAVPSVEAAARAALLEDDVLETVVVLLDARRGEFYRADYARGPWPRGLIEVAPPRLVSDAEGLPESSATCLVAREPLPDPYHVAVLGRQRLLSGGDDPTGILPLYLKRSHAELAVEQRRRKQGPASK